MGEKDTKSKKTKKNKAYTLLKDMTGVNSRYPGFFDILQILLQIYGFFIPGL